MEVSEYASIWNVYNEESAKIDTAEFDASNRGIDVLLVFTGLFSAVLTTFIIQSYQLMLPNSNTMMSSSGSCPLNSSTNSTSCSQQDGTDPGPTLTQIRWVNGLWFAALSCSLSAALFSMLAKHWLRSPPNVSGSPLHRARQRQKRYLQMQSWHVMTVVNALPLLLHVTLLLFFAGLIVLLWSGNRAITVVTCVIVILVFFCYFGSIWISMVDPDCPYQHPIAEHLRAWMTKRGFTSNSLDDIESTWQGSIDQWEELDQTPVFPETSDFWDASSLVWLIRKCPNASATVAGLQAIAGFPRDFTGFHILREAGAVPLVLREFRTCFHRDPTLDSHWYVMEPESAEKYCRAWMRLTAGTSLKWPRDLLVPLETLRGVESGNVGAIAACTRAIAFLEDKDGRSTLLSYLARYEKDQGNSSHEIQCWLLDTFLSCSFISDKRSRPTAHMAREAVPILLRLLHRTKQALASRVRSAVALSLSLMAGQMPDLALFHDEATRREQFGELLISSLVEIVRNSDIYAVDDELLDLIALELPRVASLVLLPGGAGSNYLKIVAQQGLLSLYLQGRMKVLPTSMLANVLQILYPPTIVPRSEGPLFIRSLLQTLRCSASVTEIGGMAGPVLRLLELSLVEPHPDAIGAFIEGRGIEVLLLTISTGDTESRQLQLDCIRIICKFIGTTADHFPLSSTPSSIKEGWLHHIFQSNFFSVANSFVKSQQWWLAEIAELWVPALLSLCKLRPQEPIWISVEAAFRNYAELNEGREDCFPLLDQLDEMKSLLVSVARITDVSTSHVD